MATVKLSSLKLSMTTVTGSKKQVVLCTGTAIRYKRGEDRQTTDTIEGYAVNIQTARGEVQTVKLPESVKPQIDQIKTALSNDQLVKVSFEGFIGKPWAMLDRQTGRVNSGVSVTANNVKIESIEDVNEELDFDEDIL